MHEALITRGNAMSTALAHPDQDLIYSEFNCVLRHHICPDGKHYHTSGTGGDSTWNVCAASLVYEEGYERVKQWLISVAADHFFGVTALKRFMALYPKDPFPGIIASTF